ncbi:primosomal replication protein N [Rheinheimera salexigens]|uniref:Replication restart protein PriB n=1 Tax=Rheinheimera salexigens TaxID=1628148 RepID=A0A1E7Q9Q0_9GAMM|nr:primosomal replication protein N [Rheinheimera salexigens]OEY70738.1 primosomal replication protein N [Rheinheimera salexigens]
MDNCSVLVGSLCRQPDHSESPAGIPHSVLVLEHRSMQHEAGLQRQVYVRIQVVATGTEFQQITRKLTLGDTLKVTGFLSRHQSRSGQARLVLHAQRIEQIS